MIRTYLDELALGFRRASVPETRDAIDGLVDVMDAVRRQRDEVLLFASTLWDAEVEPGVTLTDFLYPRDRNASQLRDQAVRLSSALDKATQWDTTHLELDSAPSEVVIDGQTTFAPTLGQAVAASAADGPVACLGLATARKPGLFEVEVGTSRTRLHGLASSADRPAFLRAWVLGHPPAPSEFDVWTDRCFPDLLWTDDARQGLRTHSSCFFDEHFETTMRHLSVLNDRCAEVFDTRVEPAVRQQELRSCDVTASPESPNTRANRAAAAQRRVRWQGADVFFWWHTKIRYNSGRIHFLHEPVNGERGRIVIGLCVDHLDT